MAWVDLDYYKNDFLLGRSPLISDTDFPFYERKAETRINWRHVEIDDPKDNLKQCVCEVAELIYKKASDAAIQDVIQQYLAHTEYHNAFVYRGL